MNGTIDALSANDLLLFATVADLNSLSRAALRLDMPKSTLSRRLSGLETALGERLFIRSTRKLRLTDFGEAVLVHAHQLQEEVNATRALSLHHQGVPRGRLRVSMPADLAIDLLEKILAEFSARNPELSISLDLSPRHVDLIGENFDLAIRMGDLADDATLAARSIAVLPVALYASPSYCEGHGVPSEPEALMEHETLRVLSRKGDAVPWILSRGAEQWEGMPPSRFTANSPALLTRMAVAGAGIVAVADHIAEPHVKAGRLEPVLADWTMPPATAWAVFPGRRLMPAKTRAFLDALTEAFSSEQCQIVQDRVSKVKAERLHASQMSRAKQAAPTGNDQKKIAQGSG
jgi:DNA-binding transcriptional LysR family regulator